MIGTATSPSAVSLVATAKPLAAPNTAPDLIAALALPLRSSESAASTVSAHAIPSIGSAPRKCVSWIARTEQA